MSHSFECNNALRNLTLLKLNFRTAKGSNYFSVISLAKLLPGNSKFLQLLFKQSKADSSLYSTFNSFIQMKRLGTETVFYKGIKYKS